MDIKQIECVFIRTNTCTLPKEIFIYTSQIKREHTLKQKKEKEIEKVKYSAQYLT